MNEKKKQMGSIGSDPISPALQAGTFTRLVYFPSARKRLKTGLHGLYSRLCDSPIPLPTMPTIAYYTPALFLAMGIIYLVRKNNTHHKGIIGFEPMFIG